MTDCKNCNYTDEYCASGECTSQSPRNGSQKEDLTSQWKKGELPEGFYWVKVKEEIANYPILADCVRRYEYYDVYTYFPEYEDSITSVLAPVSTFEEWQALKASYEMSNDANLKQATWMADMEKENAQLKEQINKYCLDAINRGTANTVKAVKEFGMPERIKELVEQNAQLKDLLKECRPYIALYTENNKHIGFTPETANLLQRIKELKND